MLFVVLTDQGINTQPLTATSLQDAANQIKQMYGQGTGTVNAAIVLPNFTGKIIQNPAGPAGATIQQTGDTANQATLVSKAAQALANNATYLAISNPTTAQAVAQVKALTQQMDALIRLAVGDFSATT